MGATIEGLASLTPRTLPLMHGPSFSGDGAAALRALAKDCERRTISRRLANDTVEIDKKITSFDPKFELEKT